MALWDACFSKYSGNVDLGEDLRSKQKSLGESIHVSWKLNSDLETLQDVSGGMYE